MMRTEFDHLPEAKRRELDRVVQVLFEEFEAATAHRSHQHLRRGQIHKVILFGSYARGDWVDDAVGGYVSDYDLLVVVDHEDLTDLVEFWGGAETRLLQDYSVNHRLTAPVNFIVHSLQDVNERLRHGRYFFSDIVRDGVALYEAPGHPFDRPKTLRPAEALAEAEGLFRTWFESADDFREAASDQINRDKGKLAAFLLHQATERYYHCILLVLTFYSPKSHRLNFLRSQAEQLDARLAMAWPRETKFEQRCFELLRRAYVDARYSPHYKISREELVWLCQRVAALSDTVKAVCDERVEALRLAAA